MPLPRPPTAFPRPSTAFALTFHRMAQVAKCQRAAEHTAWNGATAKSLFLTPKVPRHRTPSPLALSFTFSFARHI